MTETAKPADLEAAEITMATIRQWAERTIATSVSAGEYATPTAYQARGYLRAAKTVLAMLDMNGRPWNEPVIMPGAGD